MTDRKQMSIMELANDILSKNNKAMTFADIYDIICEIKNISEEEKSILISQVYADFISSAKFIYVGDDEWDIKGRQAIDLWDKDGAYYDEYPDFEEELSQFEDIDEDYEVDEDEDEDEEDEDESSYEQDFDIDDVDEEEIEDEDEEEIDDEFMEEFKEDFEDEDAMYDDFEKEEDEDYVEDEEDLVYEEETDEDFDDEEYNEYMDDYEKMYDD